MRKMLVTAIACLFLVSMFQTGADGQAYYRTEFSKKYKTELAGTKLTCGVCHANGGKNKKKRNDYGSAVQKALGAKKVKDKAKISKALDEAAKKESHMKGKTFGDLIKAGTLPAEPEKK
jgi:cytochrome c553